MVSVCRLAVGRRGWLRAADLLTGRRGYAPKPEGQVDSSHAAHCRWRRAEPEAAAVGHQRWRSRVVRLLSVARAGGHSQRFIVNVVTAPL
jgi:hypothetical protein